jgi:MFS transporter, PHS family, inorganic phosphate transporter
MARAIWSGVLAGAFLFPDMLASSLGIRGAEIVAGVVAAGGLLLTIAVLPEPKGKTLEQLSADAYAPATLKLEAAS